ncbi:hypothetical protein VI01_01935 [Pantoea sp. SM3]|nr:hypothetical protein VI01_01935 [Pantoea sp. SM3]
MQIGRAVHGPDALLFGLAFSVRLDCHCCPTHSGPYDRAQSSTDIKKADRSPLFFMSKQAYA